MMTKRTSSFAAIVLLLAAGACDRTRPPPPPEPPKTTTGTTTSRDVPGETTTTGADIPTTPAAEPTASDWAGARDAGLLELPPRPERSGARVHPP